MENPWKAPENRPRGSFLENALSEPNLWRRWAKLRPAYNILLGVECCVVWLLLIGLSGPLEAHLVLAMMLAACLLVYNLLFFLGPLANILLERLGFQGEWVTKGLFVLALVLTVVESVMEFVNSGLLPRTR